MTEDRHEEVLELLDVGFWVRDRISEEIYWSDHLYELFGVDPKAFDSSLEAFARFIHPDDRDGVTTSLRAVPKTRTPSNLSFDTSP